MPAQFRPQSRPGGSRGGSTISQQVVKNVFLWQGRSWPRKVLETLLTPVVEIIWSKRRILEVYLNVAEMDEGVFGAEAAARKYFGVGPEELERPSGRADCRGAAQSKGTLGPQAFRTLCSAGRGKSRTGRPPFAQTGGRIVSRIESLLPLQGIAGDQPL